MKKITVLAIAILQYVNLNAQSLAVNTDGSNANPSALLDVKSTTKGLLIPRMTKTEKNAIAAPATGLTVFQNGPDSIGYHFYNGSAWTWMANSDANQNWLITGNDDVTASNYLGTNTNTDLRFAVNSIVHTQLSSSSGFWGYNEFNPQYELDVSMGSSAVFPCTRNGLRLKPAGTSNACDYGLFVGLDNNNSITNASFWNYGNGSSGAQNLKFGLNSAEIMRINSSGFEGLGESNPQYTFDMKLGIAAVYPCIRNGIRMNNTANNNDCDKGLFVGYDNNNLMSTASFWNFGDGSTFPNYEFRFGMGSDFTNGEKMRINANGVGIGSTSPHAKLHITDRTAALLPGVMVTSPSQPSFEDGFYSGLKDNSGQLTARIWNYQNADIEFGTNNLQRMIITSSGNVGINTSSNPTSTLQVDGTVAVGVSLNLGGGPVGSPTLITPQKSYIELNPAGGAYFQLPDPASCVGRIYYLRNASNSTTAWLGTVAGTICPSSSACYAPGTYYPMNFTTTGKTVLAISNGVNWIVGAIIP